MLDHYRTPFALSEQPLIAIAKNSYGKRDFAKAERRKTENGEGDMRRRTGGGRVCWELLRPCWQWCANRCNNSKQCWDLQCIVGRVWPIRLWRQCVMRVRGFNNVGKAVQTNPRLLRYASTIMKQQKCWEMLADVGTKVWPVSNFAHAQQHVTRCTNGRNMYHLTMLGVVGQESCVLSHGAWLGKKEGKYGITGLNRLPRDFQPIVCNALGCKEDTSIARRQKTKKTSVNIILWCTHLVGKSSHRLVLT